MRKVTRNLTMALAFALTGVGAAWGITICATQLDPNTGCVLYRECCFYSDTTGEAQGCWHMYRPCDL